jgi:hypothetical protein
MKFRRLYWDGVVHPTGALCTVETAADGALHEGPHSYTEWVDGDPAYPVYWIVEDDGSITEWANEYC